jgi:SAM-dependent methyltransferase
MDLGSCLVSFVDAGRYVVDIPVKVVPQEATAARPVDQRISLRERIYWRALREFRERRRLLGHVFRPNLWQLQPISREFGFDRGKPVDRVYIEQFLGVEADTIHGRVLEVGHDVYTRMFGGDQVTQCDVLARSADVGRATIVADLSDAPHIDADSFDCIILIHTLQYIFDAPAALRTCHRILKPSGALLIAVPFIGQYSARDRELWGEFWRFSRQGLSRLLGDAFGAGNVRVDAYGNVLSATAFLHGVAAEELSKDELARYDEDYDLIVTGVATK